MMDALEGNAWLAGSVSGAYVRHGHTLRGELRHALVERALLGHLPDRGLRVLDVGGGDARLAVALAGRGHEVCVLDPDEAMLASARDRLATAPATAAERVRLVRGDGRDAMRLVGSGWDVVLCHGVLMYVEDPEPLLRTLVAVARPGAVVSVLAKNADALAMRPALEGRHAEALGVLDSTSEIGRLGLSSRADDREHLAAVLTTAGAPVVEWRGVRCATDHLGDAECGDDFEAVAELEWQLGARDPYRGVARLVHLLCRVEDAATTAQ